MGTLHLFGDSFTEGHLLDITLPSYKEWKKYRGGELPLCWGDLLSKKLNMKMANHAIAGMSNSEIFQTICRYSDEFKKNDIVIINWTYPHRFRWALWSDDIKNYIWKRLSVSPGNFEYISESTRMDIAVNKSLPPYIDEVYEQEKLLLEFSKSKGFQLFFWSPDIDIINNLPSEKLIDRKYILHEQINNLPLIILNSKHIQIVRPEIKRTIFDVFYEYGGVTIGEESNWEIVDMHLGEKGHIIQSELFYNYIMDSNLI